MNNKSIIGYVRGVALVSVLLAFSSWSLAAELELAYTDSAWEGDALPEGQQCQRFEGKKPQSPELKIGNIPTGATAVVLEFSDRNVPPMNNGGHGKVGYKISGDATEVTVPRIPGHTEELSEPLFVVANHKAPQWDTAGAYLPPCSGGRGNDYFIDVKAVTLNDEGAVAEVLAEGSIKLAKY